MDAAELEKFVGDLEIAVDRLRSLYEQYFMGIEKMEPMVPRKDVDRRIQVLRKEQIRNTAQRFRFQMILQRYNTYQTHWQRICREIENGTYKRHLLKAQRRFGNERRSSLPPPPIEPAVLAPIAGAKAPVKPAIPLLARPGAPVPTELERELAELDRDYAPAGFGAIESDDLDLDPAPGAPEVPRKGGPAWRKAEPLAPRAPGPAPGRPPPPPRIGAAPPAAPPPIGQRAAGPPPVRAQGQAPPAPQAAPSPIARPGPGAPPPPRQPAAAATQAAPAAPAVPRPGQAPGVPVAPRPAPAAPPAARPAAPAAVAPAATQARAGHDLPDDRVRQLYAQYVETKRQQKESTAAITYEAVAKSLRDSSAKLREKHGKAVDFEVSVKDGKTVLRPVIK